MLEYKFNDYTIKIDLSNGIYVFDETGAEGKTYLATQLKAFRQVIDNPDSIAVFNNENFSLDKLNKVKDKASVIMLDRADLYVDNNVIAVLRTIDSAIVLIDLKNICIRRNIGHIYVEIHLTADEIQVTKI